MRSILFLCAALVLLNLGVYWKVSGYEFLSFDDDLYISHNLHVSQGLTRDNIAWAFTSADELGWLPVTWLSYMAEVQWYGLDPRGFHLDNVFIHTASTLLLFALLFRLTGACWQSGFVAALFALHPLHVESVAWIAERKGVLSAFFGFLALWLYAGYVKRPGLHTYLCSLLAFLLGLMSKPILVPLPLVMLLLDVWPLDRLSARRGAKEEGAEGPSLLWLPLLREKLPFFAGALFCALITVYSQYRINSMADTIALPLPARVANAVTAYGTYLLKTVWPVNLAALYPLAATFSWWRFAVSFLALVTITTAVIRLRGKRPYLFVGWFWYVITLVPVIGLIQVGSHSHADRYTYIPLTGLLIIVAWGVPELIGARPLRPVLLAGLAVLSIILSAGLTWRQLNYWENNITLYRRALAVTSENSVAQYNLALALAEKGHLDDAAAEFRKAIELNPESLESYFNLGMIFLNEGRLDEALQLFRKVVDMNPGDEEAHNNVGRILCQKGYYDQAIAEYGKVLSLNPNNRDALENIAIAEKLKAK